jgi:hypothetical protein
VYVSSLSIAPEEREVQMTESCAKIDLIIHHIAWHEVADWFDVTCLTTCETGTEVKIYYLFVTCFESLCSVCVLSVYIKLIVNRTRLRS